MASIVLNRAGVPRGQALYPQLGDAEWLRQRYEVDGATSYEIAGEIGCTRGAVTAAMRRRGIATRKAAPRAVVAAGERYGRLVVLAEAGRIGKDRAFAVRCDCGAEKSVKASALTRGTRSCGCLGRERSSERLKGQAFRTTTHGHTTSGFSPTYSSWGAMWTRCRNPNSSHYENYGGAGVTVCDRWRAFEHFLEDMGERPEGTSIDRINPWGNYEPGNCRWATPLEQAHNKRKDHPWPASS